MSTHLKQFIVMLILATGIGCSNNSTLTGLNAISVAESVQSIEEDRELIFFYNIRLRNEQHNYWNGLVVCLCWTL